MAELCPEPLCRLTVTAQGRLAERNPDARTRLLRCRRPGCSALKASGIKRQAAQAVIRQGRPAIRLRHCTPLAAWPVGPVVDGTSRISDRALVTLHDSSAPELVAAPICGRDRCRPATTTSTRGCAIGRPEQRWLQSSPVTGSRRRP